MFEFVFEQNKETEMRLFPLGKPIYSLYMWIKLNCAARKFVE